MSQRLKTRIREVGADQAREELIASTMRLRAAGERSELASELRDLAELERWWSDHAASIGHYEEVVAVLRGLDKPLRLGHALRHLGQVQQESGDIDQAEACYTEAVALYREFGAAEPLQLANSVRYLAVAKHETGEAEAAAGLWQEAPRDSPCCLPSVESRTTHSNGSAVRRLPRKPLGTGRRSTTSTGSARN